MGEKRRAKRVVKRLRVRFGEAGTAGFTGTGLTNDVSSTGLFVLSSTNQKPGTRLHLEVMGLGERPLFVEGVVARQVIVPPELRQVVRSGFGVRYLQGPELMAELLPVAPAPRSDDPFTLVFEDSTAWTTAWNHELKRGGCFVWSPRTVAVNAVVKLTFDLRFAGRAVVLDARVVHVMPGADGRFGVALMCTDPAALTALAAALGA